MPDVREYVLKTPAGGVRRYDHEALCDLLKVEDYTRVIFEQGVGRQAIVRVYPSNPLMNMREINLHDLMLDARGRVTLGTYFDGSPLRFRLFDPKTGNAQRGAIFGTTGAGKSRLVQAILIACKLSGIVVHLADLKSGQSVPEAKGHVATRVTTQYETILMLRGLVAEAERRMAAYAEMGRSGFVKDAPDPLVYGIVDEANRLLEKGAPFRDEGARLIKELGRTGRSVGVGIIIAAQAGHLDELGGSDTLRGMLKEGEVILLRWSSAMMQQLVGDGLVPRGEALQPIPKVVGQVQRVRRYNETAADDEDDVNSQGMLYHLTSRRPTSMARTYVVGSVEPCVGYDPVILSLYGTQPPPGDAIDLEAYVTAKERKAAAGETGDGTGVPSAPPGGPDEPTLATMTTAQRILAALPPDGMTMVELQEALADDGGRAVRRGTISTTVSTMRDRGQLARPDGTQRIIPVPAD
ncbi:DNA/RNA helicase domain-containing protein [Streptomyces benahoarensis]|uniref:Transfer protein n=1 Tax=Streptomyces benahoarensis TaxID=2595054 RepID=A0A553ZIN5_9ACTN|nr:DNA/RNA helicase domain-containing protein [Streptomyces benahoarensis]TSB31890.1 transfer protein [Streptomyces benahoarensis]TSB41322.1 transfer protein [Streptomyces benahoarensis]